MTLVASDTPRSGEPLVADSRPTRSTAAQAPGLADTLSRIARAVMGAPFHLLTLGHGTPGTFFAMSPDSWPGDAVSGQRLLAGAFLAGGESDAIAPDERDPPWQRPTASPLWLGALNGFGW